jgi:superfamily II DNA or RNA helicase
MPPHTVYGNASKKTILKGFKLYLGNGVRSIRWLDNEEAIEIDVFDTRPHTVAISFDGSTVFLDCACDAGPLPERCEHVICALFTLINLLKPTVFRMAEHDPSYRAPLLSGLIPDKSHTATVADDTAALTMRRGPRATLGQAGAHGSRREEEFATTMSVPQIVIEERERRLSYSVERRGRTVESHGYDNLPYELRLIAGRASFYETAGDTLGYALNACRNRYPIFFRTGEERHRVTWAESLPHKTWTELDVKGDMVHVSRGCTFGKENAPTFVLGDFAFDVVLGRFCLVSKKQGWIVWEVIWKSCMESRHLAVTIEGNRDVPTFCIPLKDFANVRILLRQGMKETLFQSTRFKLDGKPVSPAWPESSAYRVRMEEAPGPGGEYLLRPECTSGSSVFSPLNNIFSILRVLEREGMPKSIRKGRRRERLIEWYFEALPECSGRAVSSVLQDVIDRSCFSRRGATRLERAVIGEGINALKQSDLRLLLDAQGWSLTPVDKEKEGLIFSIPYALFGHTIFEQSGRYGEAMVINADTAGPRLHQLRKRFHEKNIDLLFNGLPVAPVRWDLSLDATKSTIDWFEIHPEIRCNGKTIEKHIWEEALRCNGMVLRNGAMELVDQQSLENLSRVLGLTISHERYRREIVTIPRLRIIELLSLRKSGITVKLSPDDEGMLLRLTDFREIEEKQLPHELKGHMRPYQREGYYWLRFLCEQRFGACLADDMGLGKTLQAISFLAGLREEKIGHGSGGLEPVLVVVPPTLIFNWEREIERFYPAFKVYVYRGRERSTLFDGYDIILTSYALVRRDIARLKECQFSVVVFDEAQAIKNIFADTTGAVRQLKGRFKMALTGTPVENHIGEYYSIMDLVLPGLLGDYKQFLRRSKNEMTDLLPVVVERTKPFILRRTKERVLKELPPRLEQDVYLDLTEKQRKFYNRTVDEVKATIDEAYRRKTTSQAKIIALTAIMKLRQICLTPQLLVRDMQEECPKIDFLQQKLAELLSESHSCLVFSQFTSFLDLVESRIAGDGLALFRLDGSTPVARREKLVDSFQLSTTPAVFLLSLKAGGQGLNLTKASYVFHLDPWWNPAVESQASDRAHRIGQKNRVIITRLLMRHTVEEKIMELKRRKTGLYKALLESPENATRMAITKQDFDFLLAN